MPGLRLAVDAEQLVIAYLKARADVQAVLGNPARISTELPANPVFPAVVIHRIGGPWRDVQRLDQPILQVDTWAEKTARKPCHDAMTVVRAAFAREQIPGVYALGVITGADELRGPLWLPDPATARAKFTMDWQFWIHPN